MITEALMGKIQEVNKNKFEKIGITIQTLVNALYAEL